MCNKQLFLMLPGVNVGVRQRGRLVVRPCRPVFERLPGEKRRQKGKKRDMEERREGNISQCLSAGNIHRAGERCEEVKRKKS